MAVNSALAQQSMMSIAPAPIFAPAPAPAPAPVAASLDSPWAVVRAKCSDAVKVCRTVDAGHLQEYTDMFEDLERQRLLQQRDRNVDRMYARSEKRRATERRAFMFELWRERV